MDVVLSGVVVPIVVVVVTDGCSVVVFVFGFADVTFNLLEVGVSVDITFSVVSVLEVFFEALQLADTVIINRTIISKASDRVNFFIKTVLSLF